MKTKSLLEKITNSEGGLDINRNYRLLLLTKAEYSTDPKRPVDWHIPSEIAKKVLRTP